MANEKRLIDGNKAQAVLVNMAEHLLEAGNQEMAGAVGYAAEVISKQPTVDDVEVVHSRWDTVFYERNGTLATYSHLCPECKYFYKDVRFKGHNYCPNCGAKMNRGEEA